MASSGGLSDGGKCRRVKWLRIAGAGADADGGADGGGRDARGRGAGTIDTPPTYFLVQEAPPTYFSRLPGEG